MLPNKGSRTLWCNKKSMSPNSFFCHVTIFTPTPLIWLRYQGPKIIENSNMYSRETQVNHKKRTCLHIKYLPLSITSIFTLIKINMRMSTPEKQVAAAMQKRSWKGLSGWPKHLSQLWFALNMMALFILCLKWSKKLWIISFYNIWPKSFLNM